MKKLIIIISSLMVITGLSACDTDEIRSPEPLQQPENTGNDNENENPQENMKMKITIGSTAFTATLESNATATAFKKLLPITITMSELNNNEKYYSLPNSLPTNPINPKTIQNGDLMLYGSQTLVLFYKSFSTSYSYTRLGKVDDTTGLASASGSENITVIFEME
ncbi:cyclophilin-like fold protein [Dysgonomonas termitidis]|uniref:Cyclophilin-like fold protein n=1 Tax=Dysgonomonas termitidis TaxID=1516126 RepID=A0ABV9L3C1_9BACT